MKSNRCAIGLISIALLFCVSSTWAQKQEALSNYFVAEHVNGGLFRGARLNLYVRTPEGQLNYIGSTLESEWMADPRRLGKAGEGLQESVVAVSQDGRSIVFLHQPAVAKKGFKQEGGIYRYEYGKGATFLHKLDNLQRSWTLWPKPIPRNVLVFQFNESVDPQGVRWALTAEGEQFPLALLGGTPLHKAAYEGRAQDVAAILEKKQEIDARTYWGFTALETAIIRGHEEVGNDLLQRGANPTAGQYPSFYFAVRYGMLRLMQAMVDRGVDINAPDPSGWAPLHIAVLGPFNPGDVSTVFGAPLWNPEAPPKSFPNAATWILKHGANPNVKDKEGKTALHLLGETYPTRAWMVAAMKLLIQHGTDPGARDSRGNALLHIFASRGCGDERYYSSHPDSWQQSDCRALLELIVSRSSDLNARNAAGLTPLQLAVEANKIVTAQFLVIKGADDTVRDAQGRTMRERIEQTLSSKWWKAR